MRRLALIGAVLTLALTIFAFSIYHISSSKTREPANENEALTANEIANLIAQGSYDEAEVKANQLRETLTEDKKVERGPEDYAPFLMLGVCILFIGGTCLYVGWKILRPFHKLEHFADEVALGNLDMPLEYERTNWFGKFTFAFDNMRNEIKRARNAEQEAVENNKTVIATLSHDIKTPISSIRAYAEAMEMGMDATSEMREQYVSTIMEKCDEVSKLSEDMLMHALADMERLRLYPTRCELGHFLEENLAGASLVRPQEEVFVMVDELRLGQVIENILSNAKKYADGHVEARLDVKRDDAKSYAVMTFRDHGQGIPDEDLPFVFEKFYRGRNIGKNSGAGLGLFIVKYIIENSNGTIRAYNDGGLVIEIRLPVLP